MLSERLQDMVSSFNANLRPHYEAQANAIQVDINLIHRADPYQNKPLEDSPDEIDNLIRNTVGGKMPVDPVAEADFLADAGKLYKKFVHEVNDALEDRDVNLTLLHVGFVLELARLSSVTYFSLCRTSTEPLLPNSNSATTSTCGWRMKNTKCLRTLCASA
jgi:hypothetical protein